MFDFFKKNKKEFVEQEPQVDKKIRKSPTQDEEIAYLEAKDYINDVQGIMSRYTYWLSQIDKDQTEEEKAHIAWINTREKELWQEEHDLDLYNKAKNNKIIDVYSKLMKEYFAMPVKSDKEIEEKGLPEKYVTTKVDLLEFDQDKGA